METRPIIELTSNKTLGAINDAVKFYGMANMATIHRSIKSGAPVSKGPNAGLQFAYVDDPVELEDSEYPRTRKQAQEEGAKYYFTGKPCVRGHIAPRLTKGACTECRKEDWAKENAQRAEKPKSEAAKAAQRRWYSRNRETLLRNAKDNPNPKQKEYNLRYKKKNPDLFKAYTNARRRRLKDATPPWITAEQRKEIREMYSKALEVSKITGEPYEVDHIIPIKSALVCGLHVPWNLRILHKSDNLKKSNQVRQKHAVPQ